MIEILSASHVTPEQAKLPGDTLRKTLDDLLERYLNLLDQYQSLQQSLAKELSSLSVSEPIERFMQEIISISTLQPMSKQPGSEQAKDDGRSAEKGKNAETRAPISDPLRWFGVLVPPALRTSQNSFKTAVTEAVPPLVNVLNEMKSLEIEIRRTRKKIRKAG
ncbi:MAG: hypothetical protein Q9225_002257 [Loekoesia sp. 1 TL-2023]